MSESKIRINDLARELEVKSRCVIEYLSEIGVSEKRSHSSAIDEALEDRVRQHFKPQGPKHPEEKPAATLPAPTPRDQEVRSNGTARVPDKPVQRPDQPATTRFTLKNFARIHRVGISLARKALAPVGITNPTPDGLFALSTNQANMAKRYLQLAKKQMIESQNRELGTYRLRIIQTLNLVEGKSGGREKPGKRLERLKLEGRLPRHVYQAASEILNARNPIVYSYQAQPLPESSLQKVRQAWQIFSDWAKLFDDM